MSPTTAASPAPAPATDALPKPSPGAKRSLMGSLIDATALLRAASFKEDSYVAAALPASDLRALADLRALLATHPDQISIWGVPLNPPSDAPADERTDVVLLKFLRARDFRVRDAHAMLLRCAAWRAEFRADAVLDEDLGFKDLEGIVAYMHGWDREGHPVCYNAYGVFKDRDMYDRVFGDGDRLSRFLRWRVQIMERGVRSLQLRPGGVNAIIQVTDLKDMPKRELRAASNQILSLFQDNYPEMVARKAGATITWDLVVGGWELEYGAEYVPAAEGGYTLCVERTRKVPAAPRQHGHNAFTAKEPGKMVLSIDNSGSRKRKVAAYRYFVPKPSA
uniref:CRAL/TRIO N-terminal domain-containing protein n=1 Tax=Aegilops tauschii TaxID=37682 RepID=M8BFK2_AEGTA